MSRIDEALKLAKAGGIARGEDTQVAFAPAWTVDEPSVPRADDDTLAVPSRHLAEPEPPASEVDFATTWRERLATGHGGNAALLEQFRRLAASLHHERNVNGLRSVMVTSAAPGDGKTLTAVNLALVLSESYRYNVLLMDADLRRPSIPGVLDVDSGSGLSETLRAAGEQKLALLQLTNRLTMLPAGQPIANSLEALTSPRMQQILEEAMARYDWVILDAPPIGSTTDARVLAEMVGGTLFVIHAGQTQYPAVRHALDQLGQDRILGVVLNGVDDMPAKPYYYGVAHGGKD